MRNEIPADPTARNAAVKENLNIAAVLAGAVLLAALGVVVTFRAFGQIEEASAARKQALVVINSANGLLSELTDAETGQRGYVLTGDKAFLKPYLSVRGGIRAHIQELSQMTLTGPSRKYMDKLAPLIDSKMAELAHVIELCRKHDITTAVADVRLGRGRRLMESIRAEMSGFIQAEEDALARHEADFNSTMRRLFVLIVIASLCVLLLALGSVYLIYRGTRQRLANLVHLETRHFLEIQEETNRVLEKTNAELESARSAADKASLAKSDFLSSMSHELRSPLNAILGFAQLLNSDSPPATPPQKASIDEILRAGWYLLELINEVLDLAAIESGKTSLSTEPVSLAEVMSECRAMIEPQGQKRGVTLTFPQFAVPCFVHADRTRLKQVLLNLLSNAVKYNREHGTVEVTCAAGAEDRMRISIMDGGMGLPPEKLTQLFQPFNRLGQESGVEQGTGIGLMMSKRLVELMGGAVGVESAVGVGSVFWFELRSAAAPLLPAAKAEPASAVQAQARNGAGPRTLLYVEDNPANLKLVEHLIARRPDLRFLSAATGDLGIGLARANLPDVILMDINLPGISGIQALKILREDPATARIPVLALSANAMPRDVKKGLEAGFFGYLTKPIKVEEFMDALDAALAFAEDQSGRDKKAMPVS